MSDSLRPHGLQHTRLFCTPLSPRVCSNSRPLSWWCYLTISSSAAAFSFCLPPFPASRSFPMSQLLQSGSQSIRASAMASVLLKNSQGWIPLGLTGLLSLWSKNLLRVFSSTTVRKHQFFSTAFCMIWISRTHMTTGKNIALTIWVFVSKVMSLLFNIWAFQVVLVVKNPFANAGDGFSPWVRKIPWRRAWQPTPVL